MELNEPAVKYYTLANMSVDDYVDWEPAQPDKHELIAGKVIAMAGASIAHNTIVSNIIGKIQPALSGSTCKIFPSDLRVSAKAKESYFYPDATIVCGEIELDEKFPETVKNPSVVFEILSPSTADIDLGRKFFIYMQIESLKEIITIDSQSCIVRLGRRKPDNLWQFEVLYNMNDELQIPTIKQTLSLADLYNGIQFSKGNGQLT